MVGVEGEKDRSTLVDPATATCLPDAISDRSRADCTMLIRIARQSAHLTPDIRLDASCLRRREQLRRDGHAPFLDGLGSLQAGRNGSIFGFVKFYTPTIDSIKRAHDGANSFPGHTLGPLEHDRYRCQQRPVPMSLQCSPAALDRIVAASYLLLSLAVLA